MNKNTIRIVSVNNEKISGIEIGSDNKYENKENKHNIIDISMNRNIYLGLLVEMKKAGIDIDEELKCFNNRIFTIVETEWRKPVKDLNVIPIAFGVALRKDLEYIFG